MKIYLATSYRNPYYEDVLKRLECEGHEVYDFKKPWGAERGFHWTDISINWQDWSSEQYINLLTTNPIAEHGFKRDRDAIEWADALVLLRPSGTSAHSEFGYAAGRGKKTAVLIMEKHEPELMLAFANYLTTNVDDLCNWLAKQSSELEAARLIPGSRL